VTRQLGPTEIRAAVAAPGVPLATRCQRLLQLADDRAGHDNVTAVLVQC
jgi:serine/threonine protein phosphatase PrpC